MNQSNPTTMATMPHNYTPNNHLLILALQTLREQVEHSNAAAWREPKLEAINYEIENLRETGEQPEPVREESHNKFRDVFPAAPVMKLNGKSINEMFEAVILTGDEMIACGLWACFCDEDGPEAITHAIVFQHGWHIGTNERMNFFEVWLGDTRATGESITELFKALCLHAEKEGCAIEVQKS